MKAVPLWQPWASLVAIGAKRVETRSYPPSRFSLEPGDRIAIYATKGGMSKGEELDWLWVHHDALAQLAGHLEIEARAEPVQEKLPRGAIVCTCTLVRASRVTRQTSEELRARNPAEFSYGDYLVGPDGQRERWAWVLADVELFDPPVPATTRQQGAFTWPPDDEKPDVAAPAAAEPAQGVLL